VTARLLASLRANRADTVRFLKFLVVGAVGAAVDFGTLYLLHPVLGLRIVPANTISFTVAVLSNFTWNRFWTYPDSRSKPIWTQLPQFIAVNVVGWGINTGLLLLLRGPYVSFSGTAAQSLGIQPSGDLIYAVGYNLAKATATGVVLFWNFFVNRFWTYSDVE